MADRNMKLLLIEPPFYRLYKNTYSLDRFPLSLAYLSSIVKRDTDWDVMVYNSDFYPTSEPKKVSYLSGEGFVNYLSSLENINSPIWLEVKKVIEDYNPDVIGISVKSQNFASARNIARLAKEFNRKITIIFGGPHVSMVGKEIFTNEFIDIGVRGEGEMTLLEVLDTIKTGKNLENVKGIIFRKENTIIENPAREYIKDLDTLPHPFRNYTDVLKDAKKYPKTSFANIFTTRGCPYNCFFCGSRNIWSNRVRFRSIPDVIEEVKSLQKMGLDVLHFADDTFGVKDEHIQSLCRALIEECPGISWSCELHVKLVKEETIALMKKAGCWEIQMGIESGNNQILKDIRKNITIEEALEAVRIIKKHKLHLLTFFIVGFPQETEETIRDTINVIKKTDSDGIVLSIFTPYPGTEAFDYCKTYSLIDNNFDVALYNHQSPENCFCRNISKERFRELVREVEKIVDEKNSSGKKRGLISFSTFNKIKKQGLLNSMRKGFKILFGK
ncbi:MAG: radical SAM protein [bacterium]